MTMRNPREFKIRSMLVVLALAGSAFLGACTPNGGGSVNSSQNSQPAVEQKDGSKLNNFSGVQEPSEGAEKEQRERKSGTEGREGGEGAGHEGTGEGGN